jgi:acetylornithine deacetylase/succinyl-diaminopimelate desuccinylase-like protein
MTSDRRLDWDRLTEEATRLLSDYIRVDTVNPPGNETRACEWLGPILDREGIPFRLYDPGDGNRRTLVATLPGTGARGRALMLLNHTDVVPFEREHWSFEPMSGEVRDGYVLGRGASDMKGMGIIELMVFLLHKRLDLPLSRDLVFMAVADEEAGSAYGVEFLAKSHPELLQCDYVINEGGSGTTEVFGVRRPVFSIGVAEKGPFWLRLSTTGRPGHGSVPHDDNAADRLVRALQRVLEWQRPLMPSVEVMEYFQQLHRGGVLAEPITGELLQRLATEHPRIHSVQTNSISLTQLQSGVKHNVIPAAASATLDVRLVPGYDPDRFLTELRATIDDDKVIIEEVFRSSTPASPLDTELYAVMTRAVKSAVEDAVVVPGVSTGFTDSRVFRRLGIPAYGFVPVLLEPEDVGRAHGNDERLSIENLRLGMQILLDTVRGICA